MLHVRFAGRSFDVRLSTLDIGILSDDDQIKRALASHLDVPVGKFADYTIDRHANGNLTLRPEAVFG
jgi:3-deoxy-D-arabino-heptulosonate 7-phosphate (DAHP) synthase